MNRFVLTTAVAAALLASSQPGLASEVTGLTTFVAGTPARADQVNANFSAVKIAVDDNHARLAVVEGNKQNRVTGTCAAGSSIRAINVDGTVVCEVDDAAVYSAVSPISLSGTTFSLAAGGITNAHISPIAAIAASKISGDMGIEYNNTWWSYTNIPSSVTSLGSIVVSAPGAGTVLLFLNGTAQNAGVNMMMYFGIGTSATAFSVQRPVTPSTNNQNYSAMWAYPVSAAGDYTFHALAQKVDPSACCTASTMDVNLVALYVPKRY